MKNTNQITTIAKEVFLKGILFVPSWKICGNLYGAKEKASHKKRVRAAAFACEMANLGFLVNPKDVENVRADHLTLLIEVAKETIGHNLPAPMFPGFPEANMEISDLDILYAQLVGYVADAVEIYTGEDLRSQLSFGPAIPRNSRFLNISTLKALRVEDENAITERAANTLRGRSMSDADKEFVDTILYAHAKRPFGFRIFDLIEDNGVTSREIAAWLRFEQTKYDFDLENVLPVPVVKDALRFAAVLSGGDESLGVNVRFKLSSENRRRVWDLFTQGVAVAGKQKALGQLAEEPEKFKRLFEVIHPSKMDDKLGVVSAFFAGEAVTYNSKLETAFRNKDLRAVIALLKEKPGVFARRFNQALSLATEINPSKTYPAVPVISAFASVSNDVPVQVLWQMLNFFEGRDDEKSFVFPKKKGASPFSYENDFIALTPADLQATKDNLRAAISRHYAKMESLEGKTVFVAPEMAGFTVPQAQRSASRALKAVGRGSRISIAEKANCIRGFVYWVGSGVDLDLSIVFMNEKFEMLHRVAYYSQRLSLSDCGVTEGEDVDEFIAVHSGDITSAPKGATEYVDFDVERARRIPGCRYVALVVNSYSGDGFCTLPAAFCGAMEREAMNNDGEVFEPSSVRFKADLCGDNVQCIPMVIDLIDNQFIWTDVAVKGDIGRWGNVDRNKQHIASTVSGTVNKRRTNLYDLFYTACSARGATFLPVPEWDEEDDDGNIVTKKADMIFSVEEGVTPYDAEIISGEWL